MLADVRTAEISKPEVITCFSIYWSEPNNNSITIGSCHQWLVMTRYKMILLWPYNNGLDHVWSIQLIDSGDRLQSAIGLKTQPKPSVNWFKCTFSKQNDFFQSTLEMSLFPRLHPNSFSRTLRFTQSAFVPLCKQTCTHTSTSPMQVSLFSIKSSNQRSLFSSSCCVKTIKRSYKCIIFDIEIY